MTTACRDRLGRPLLLRPFFDDARLLTKIRFADLWVRKLKVGLRIRPIASPGLNLANVEASQPLTRRRRKGAGVVEGLPNLTLRAIYPSIVQGMNLNTCPDPDCGNYGISPDPIHQSFVGRGAAQRRLLASVSNPAIGVGLGRYKMEADTNESLRRVSQFLEYEGDSREWYDGRTLVCQHSRGNAECGLGSIILSNQHFADEAERLASQNGLLDGPRCGACGTRYLDRPEEFAFNGANGKTEGRSGKEKATGVRVVHRPCRGDNRARFTVSPEHCRQKDRKENITILHHLVNGAGINDLRRLLTPEKGRRAVGVKHIYNRILWLERVDCR
jgi:hypothetical protein